MITSFERLGGKYGECVNDKSEVRSYYYAGEYTTDGCLRSCYQDAVVDSCGCMDPRFPIKEDVRACDLPQRVCTMNISNERGDPSQWPECHCPLPCANGQYVAQWTHHDFWAVECDSLIADNASYHKCLKEVGDRVLISVSMPYIMQNNFKEEPKMDFNKFISMLGGLLGVLCGICIITIFEMAYLIGRLMVVLVFDR
uniref:Sodium channel protein Nach n=1 Tax=Steinernema glaseri TaxID=37863 RepID=A0A1I8AB37_9BILA